MKRPDPEEVTAYARTLYFSLNGHYFCDYYEARGWKIGNTPMKDWKAAVRTWKHNQGGANMAQPKPNTYFVAKRDTEAHEKSRKDVVTRDAEFDRIWRHVQGLPDDEFDIIEREAVKRLPNIGTRIQGTLMPSFMVAIWKERQEKQGEISKDEGTDPAR